MGKKNESQKFSVRVNASAREVFTAFTNATALCEWLCNIAQAEAREGGRLYLWWNSGYYASGEFISLKPFERLVFSWHGREEPGDSRVKVNFTVKEDTVQVSLTHSGIGSGKAWEPTRRQIKKGWKTGLENLKSVLETGVDLRLARLPMVGLTATEALTAEKAEQLGLPVQSGLLIQGLMDGMGAQQAGLQAGDILVKLGKKALSDDASLFEGLRGMNAGDEVKVSFYRDGELQSLKLKLSPRPLPEVPFDAVALHDRVKDLYDQLNAELNNGLKGVSEQHVAFQPSEKDWSILQVLAHLVATERDTHAWISALIEGQEADFVFHSNQLQRLQAVVKSFPTTTALVKELKLCQNETLTMISELPAEFVGRKRSFWRLGYLLLLSPYHYRDHLQQIQNNLKLAQSAPPPA